MLLLLLLPAAVASPPCAGRRDCSHNGECVAGTCRCSAGWRGTDCHQLNFRADGTSTSLGLNAWNRSTGANTSSWGGAVVRGDDGLYHMWAAVMAKGCGLGAYKSNSFVGHATSPDPVREGFTLREPAILSYAHEPSAIRAPTGEYVLYFTAAYRRNGSDWRQPVWGDEAAASPGPVDCTVPLSEQRGFSCDAATHRCVNVSGNPQFPSHGQCVQMGCEHTRTPGRYQPGCLSWGCWDDPTYMSWSRSPDGPWSTPVIVLDPLPTGDTNLAGVIGKDGSFVGIWREPAPVFDPASGELENGQWVSAMRPVRASDWRDPSTYWVQPSTNLFPPHALPEVSSMGLEDPMLWVDKQQVYHAVMSDGRFHAWSEDGASWTLTPAMEMSTGLAKCPHGFAGRPHLVLGADGATPIALTGSCYFDKPVPFGGSTFTALLPIDP